ncbi:endonuclease [Microbulbifer rhizosphaerae]|uniref:Endonuclease I n=1 Tax=Microbulbifer rhizosphaerae TaxID=1562603 RepID=A0A7W4W981_9GAMM|nr:endonuclease [Microbulbifer rhizosphaerae]MBB3059944.1 endonuclease I [Microbulbifer rhizosphaerae]
MKQYLGVFLLLSVFSQWANADVANGDFENWTGGSPDGWTTIDSGISVSQSTSVVYGGNSSAAITVRTGEQSSTDFRQTVGITAGQTYDFSVWVRHTEGHVSARLYVNGYRDYTNYSLTGQWQQLSYSLTASSSGTIEVGLRFYDRSGFDGTEVVYVDTFEPTGTSGGDSDDGYYDPAKGLSGYSLKTALYNIIRDHSAQSYSALWSFYAANDLDYHYEQDGSILDIYSEKPTGSDSYNYTAVSDQCGNYDSEGDCYNREHSFPRSWFGGAVAPMNTDVHHIFASDGYVNALRSSYPYGEVATTSAVSSNGSKLGSGQSSQGYIDTVFEPIDEFKGDVARAHFYMATRYQNVIASWENYSIYGDAVLDGSSNQVFEDWALQLLIDWHNADPVSQWELDRNDAAQEFQGNRNPFVDHPEYVESIWGQ